MMKCPDNEVLMSYADGELDAEELAVVSAHLNECKVCAAELKAASEDSAVIKAGFDEMFARHRVSDKVMNQIRKAPVTVAPEVERKSFFDRLLWPALGLAILFLALVLMMPSSSRYQGTLNSVSYHALNENSTVNSVVVTPSQVFTLQSFEKQTLQGNFLFLSLENPSEFTMQGNAVVSLDDRGMVHFTEAQIELDLVKGTEFKVMVNSEPVSLQAGSVNFRNFTAVKPEAPISVASTAIDLVACPCDSAVIASTAAESPLSDATSGTQKIDVPVNTISEPTSETAASSTATIQVDEPASGVEHITNPFVDKPLGQGQ